jgi:hypothetical protein
MFPRESCFTRTGSPLRQPDFGAAIRSRDENSAVAPSAFWMRRTSAGRARGRNCFADLTPRCGILLPARYSISVPSTVCRSAGSAVEALSAFHPISSAATASRQTPHQNMCNPTRADCVRVRRPVAGNSRTIGIVCARLEDVDLALGSVTHHMLASPCCASRTRVAESCRGRCPQRKKLS